MILILLNNLKASIIHRASAEFENPNDADRCSG